LTTIKNVLGSSSYDNLYICFANPSYSSDLLIANGANSVLGNDKVYVTLPTSRFYNSEGSQNLISLLKENGDSSINFYKLGAYVSQYNLYHILEKCVAENNLTRENLVKNINAVKYSYDGIITPKLHKGLTLETFIVNVIKNSTLVFDSSNVGIATLLLKEENIGFYISDLLVDRGTAPPTPVST